MCARKKNMTVNSLQGIQKDRNRLVAGAFWMCISALCSSTGVSAQTHNYSRNQSFGRVFVQSERVVDRLSRMVFYHPHQASAAVGVASVYVNGSYHVSLMPGGYSELCLPVGPIELGLKTYESGSRVIEERDTTTVTRGRPGESQYFRVREIGRARQALQPVPVQEALSELSSTREQIHTLTRVPDASECVINRNPS